MGPELNAAALAAVARADERTAYVKAHPLPNQDVLFPGMKNERAAFYMEQIRAVAYGPRTPCAALHWWNEQLSRRDRLILCRFAKADTSLSDRSWINLNPIDRAQMLAAFHWLAEWTDNFDAPLHRFTPIAFDPA